MTKYLLPITKAVTPIKYMGSKSRIAKHIVPIIQKYINEYKPAFYLEPFVGGANVIDKIQHHNKVGSDKNKYLIALLKHVQSGKPLYESVPKELYDKARTAFNNGDTSDFEDWQIGCLIYADPPYANTKQYKNAANFNYEEFWQTMRDWSKNNIVIVSEQNAPDDFEVIWEQPVSRSIKAANKSVSIEKLFKYKGGK